MKIFNNLEAFIVLYQLKSFTKTAKKINRTRGAIQVQIKALESYLGGKLFERKGKEIIPTEMAHNFASLVAIPYEQLDHSVSCFHKYSPLLSGPIKIGCGSEIANHLVVPKISLCVEKNISIFIEMFVNNAEILDALLKGMLDFGFVTNIEKIKGCEYIKVFSDELVMVGNKRWKNYISDTNDEKTMVKQLVTLKWLAYHKDLPYLRDYFIKVFDNNASEIKPAITIANYASLIYSMALGMGIMILPKFLLQHHPKKELIEQLYFPKNVPLYNIYLIWKKEKLQMRRMKFFKDLICSSHLLFSGSLRPVSSDSDTFTN